MATYTCAKCGLVFTGSISDALREDTMVRLNEFTKLEWWDIARKLRPAITQEEFEQDWAAFVYMKQQRAQRQA